VVRELPLLWMLVGARAREGSWGRARGDEVEDGNERRLFASRPDIRRAGLFLRELGPRGDDGEEKERARPSLKKRSAPRHAKRERLSGGARAASARRLWAAGAVDADARRSCKSRARARRDPTSSFQSPSTQSFTTN
jgi:hypothetical protein